MSNSSTISFSTRIAKGVRHAVFSMVTKVLEIVKLVVYVKRVLKAFIHRFSNPQTFMCEICADEKPKNENFRVLGCNHSYCSECMRKYVASKLQDNVVAIDCPVSWCKGFLEPEHCISILPKQVLDRWGDALCEAVILATEKFYCPYKDCSALLIDDTKGKNHDVIAESECPHCNRLFCAQCKVPWHSGIDCARFKKKKKKDERDDTKLMNLAKKKKWMRCPKCNFFVEKIDGCFHIECRCGHNFCYKCGLPDVDNFLHVCARNRTRISFRNFWLLQW